MSVITNKKEQNGYVAILKNKFTKEIEYASLEDVKLTLNGPTLKDYISMQKNKIESLEDEISSLKRLLKDYQENSTKLIENAIKASSAALEVAQKQSIQIEILNQEVFSNE